MSEYRSFKTGEILSDNERAKLSPADKKRYDLEQLLRGLMKLADDETASDGERENATRLIAKLITRHQIDLALIREKETGKASGPVKIVRFKVEVSNRFNLGGVRACALHRAVILPLGGYSTYVHDSSSTRIATVITAYLPEDVVDFAKMLLASLAMQVETSMKVASVQHQRELNDDWRTTKNVVARLMGQFRKGYLLSWGTVVGRRIAEGRKEARDEAQQFTGKELAVLNTADLAKKAAEDWHKEQGTKVRAARSITVSDTGRSAGRRDGMRAQLGINEVGGRRTAISA